MRLSAHANTQPRDFVLRLYLRGASLAGRETVAQSDIIGWTDPGLIKIPVLEPNTDIGNVLITNVPVGVDPATLNDLFMGPQSATPTIGPPPIIAKHKCRVVLGDAQDPRRVAFAANDAELHDPATRWTTVTFDQMLAVTWSKPLGRLLLTADFTG